MNRYVRRSSCYPGTLLQLSLLLACLFLTGCGTFQSKISSTEPWPQHQADISDIKTWTLRGKLGVKSPSNNHSASLYWRQDLDHYQIQLSGPLGQGKIRLQGTAKHLRLERSKQATIETSQPEELLIKELGWLLPIKQIHFWAKGLPAPGIMIDQQKLVNGTLAQLQQAGWTLQYSRYQRSNTHLLPGKISMSKEQIRLILIAKQWQFDE